MISELLFISILSIKTTFFYQDKNKYLTDAVNSALRHGFGGVDSVSLTTALIRVDSVVTPLFAAANPSSVSKNFISLKIVSSLFRVGGISERERQNERARQTLTIHFLSYDV